MALQKGWKTEMPEYRAYIDAKSRCNNPNSGRYYTHGGRGIKFLFSSFDEFFAEIGKRPEGMTLDRIDNNGNYEKGNVRWATPSQQMSNRNRYTRKFRVRNEVAKKYKITTPTGDVVEIFNMAEFCRNNGLTKSTLHQTIKGKYTHKGYKAQYA
jgi:hypothetical protein